MPNSFSSTISPPRSCIVQNVSKKIELTLTHMITSDKYLKEKCKSILNTFHNKVYKNVQFSLQVAIYKRREFMNTEPMVLSFVPEIFWRFYQMSLNKLLLTIINILSMNPMWSCSMISNLKQKANQTPNQ
jgi:hypothetical protein